MTVLLRLSTVLLLALSVFLSAVSARPQFNPVEGLKKREGSDLVTNAARMAAGLGPLMPRNLFNPDRVKLARAPQPSGAPLSGRIKITDGSGGFIGFVNKNYRPDGSLIASTNANAQGDHLTVSFPAPASSSSLFNLLITSQGNPGPSAAYVGFALSSTTLKPFPSTPYFTTLTGTNPTTAGGIAQAVGNGMSSTNPFSESPIWSYDASTGRLSDTWFNPSSPGSSTGTSVAVHNYYLASTKALVQSISDLTPFGYREVFFTLV